MATGLSGMLQHQDASDAAEARRRNSGIERSAGIGMALIGSVNQPEMAAAGLRSISGAPGNRNPPTILAGGSCGPISGAGLRWLRSVIAALRSRAWRATSSGSSGTVAARKADSVRVGPAIWAQVPPPFSAKNAVDFVEVLSRFGDT